MNTIKAEDLLLRLKKAEAEITLLRKQNSELVQRHSANEAYIKELEQNLLKRQTSEATVKKMNEQIENLKAKVERQKTAIKQLQYA